MKLLIAGSRNIAPIDMNAAIISVLPLEQIDEIVSGGASGVDFMAESWARKQNIPLRIFNADWDTHGRAAGHIRNEEMAKYCDKALLIWNGWSRGTENMTNNLLKHNKPFILVTTSWSVDFSQWNRILSPAQKDSKLGI